MREENKYQKTWNQIIKIHNEELYEENGSKSPKKATERMLSEIDSNVLIDTFAIVSKIKKNDGRIYGRERDWMNEVALSIPYELLEYGNNNTVYRGLDDIHPSHIHQYITWLRLNKGGK